MTPPGRVDQLADQLADAMEADAISIWYRPIRRLHDGRLAAVQAVPRWSNPRFGPDVIGLDRLRTAAAQAGLAAELDLHVLDRAAGDLAHVIGSIRVDEPWLAVPVRTSSFADPAFVACVSEIVRERCGRPDGLALDIEESVASPASAAALEELRDAGMWVAAPALPHDPRRPTLDVDLLRTDAGDRLDVEERARQARARGARLVVTGIDRPERITAARRAGADFGLGSALGRTQPLPSILDQGL